MLFCSCTVHRHPRPRRHHPYRHRVVILAEQAATMEQSKDGITVKNVWL